VDEKKIRDAPELGGRVVVARDRFIGPIAAGHNERVRSGLGQQEVM
jgi:hypothetical protein